QLPFGIDGEVVDAGAVAVPAAQPRHGEALRPLALVDGTGQRAVRAAWLRAVASTASISFAVEGLRPGGAGERQRGCHQDSQRSSELRFVTSSSSSAPLPPNFATRKARCPRWEPLRPVD